MSRRPSKPTRRPAKKQSLLAKYVVPHRDNDYHPALFKRAAVTALVLAVVVFEGAYVVDTRIAQHNTNFLASVLPAALLDLTNGDRVASGVAPLKNDLTLAKAAQLKANDMAQNGYFAHVSPSGKTPWYWLDQVGYSYTYVGENLAINFDDSSAVEEAWMNSPTHRANIVKPQYTRVGYAVAQGMYEGKETTFVVQEFATTPADETVTAEVKPKSIASAVEKAVSVVAPKKTAVETTTGGKAGASTTTSLLPTKPTVSGSEAEATSGTPMVLSTQENQTITSDSGIANFLKQVAASPHRTSVYVLGSLATLMLILLGYALLAHARVRTLEVLVGGLIVISFALGILIYNATHTLAPIVPQGTDAALEAQSP